MLDAEPGDHLFAEMGEREEVPVVGHGYYANMLAYTRTGLRHGSQRGQATAAGNERAL